MNFRELYLEETEIPGDYLDNPQDDLYWESDEYLIFYLSIRDILHKGREAVCYGLDIIPLADGEEEWAEVAEALENKGYDADGYGWESYLLDYIEQENPALAARLGADSESGSCGLYVLDSLEDYRALLGLASAAIRELV